MPAIGRRNGRGHTERGVLARDRAGVDEPVSGQAKHGGRNVVDVVRTVRSACVDSPCSIAAPPARPRRGRHGPPPLRWIAERGVLSVGQDRLRPSSFLSVPRELSKTALSSAYPFAPIDWTMTAEGHRSEKVSEAGPDRRSEVLRRAGDLCGYQRADAHHAVGAGRVASLPRAKIGPKTIGPTLGLSEPARRVPHLFHPPNDPRAGRRKRVHDI